MYKKDLCKINLINLAYNDGKGGGWYDDPIPSLIGQKNNLINVAYNDGKGGIS